MNSYQKIYLILKYIKYSMFNKYFIFNIVAINIIQVMLKISDV
jgi:hypothetical protein